MCLNTMNTKECIHNVANVAVYIVYITYFNQMKELTKPTDTILHIITTNLTLQKCEIEVNQFTCGLVKFLSVLVSC